jgi:hypothetical protein
MTQEVGSQKCIGHANVDRVRTLVRSDRRLGVRLIAEEMNMNRETMRQILTEDLGMRKISAKSNLDTGPETSASRVPG